MSKSITEQIADLQSENERLKELQKLFDKAVKNEFGEDVKSLHKLLESRDDSPAFSTKLRSYFNLKTQQDLDDFLSVFCTNNSLEYFKKNRAKGNSEVAE